MTATDQAAPSESSGRLRSLDGLRGVAALVVLVHHSSLLLPAFSATYGDGTSLPPTGSLIWWLSYSPLKLLTAGGEAVIVFFVLSGVVLTLPVLRAPTFDWVAYFPQRVIRLWLPVLGSVVVAAVLILLVPQIPFEAPGTWLSTFSTPSPQLVQFIDAANLFDHGSVAFHVNNPLWSLAWELVFSLALPIFVLVAIVVKRWWIPALIVLVLITAVGRWFALEPLDFLPSFMIGALIAVKSGDVQRLAANINKLRSRHLIWAVITVAGALLLIASWLPSPLLPVMGNAVQLLNALTPVGAALIVIACMGWSALNGLLSARPVQWAGRISFSLYLTHVPVLIFTTYLLRGIDLRIVIPVGITFAIIVGAAFYLVIESRCHALARTTGKRASAAFQRYRASQLQDTV
jgi:peptidoglycan/LPS O-acetylase OafA/YrhL